MANIRDADGSGQVLLLSQSIFISHSGLQKSIAEELFWDLKNRGHTVFFDKSPESLPKGEAFPERILQAARQCAVAVVVLSEEYLTSKWPMLELVTFVKAQRSCNSTLRILPLFYQLDVSDLKNQGAIQRWKAEWERLAAGDDRGVDPQDCEEALRVLTRSNGERFSEYRGSMAMYRKAIVSSLYRLSWPYLKYGTPAMVGRTRLCQIITGELERQSQVNGGRHAVLGLSGLGGMGKTLLCKALCNQFREEYAGRVCHVECAKSLGTLELQKLILEELTDTNVSYIKTSGDALILISQLLGREPVFLAVDNVQEGDLKWLEDNIFNPRKSKQNPRSKFVVTSRCLSNVQSLVINRDSCWTVPSLTEKEAMKLFIQSAFPTARLPVPPPSFKYQQIRKILRDCISQCYFSNESAQDSRSSSSQSSGAGHYNPMLLQTLGSSIGEAAHPSRPQHFIEKCRMSGKLQYFHKHPVFETLRTEYDALPSRGRDKLLFLDVALFAPREKLRKLDDLCTWLEAMHDDRSAEEIFQMLINLRKKSLVDWETNTDSSQVTVHDLFRDFAAYELREVEADERKAVYQRGGRCDLPQSIEGSPPGRIWHDLVRVHLHVQNQLPDFGYPQPELHVLRSIVLASQPFRFPDRGKIGEWQNLQLLCLEGFESEELDITPLKYLRSLKLASYELRNLLGCHKLEKLRFVELNCSGLRHGLRFPNSSKMQELVTGEIYSLKELCLPQSPSNSLKVLKLHGWNKYLPRVLDVGKHRQLSEFAIVHTIWDTGRASSWGNWSLNILGLKFLRRLVGLTLVELPITSLPGLENLVGLKFLNLRGCAKLESVPNLRHFKQLEWVDRDGCERLPPGQPLVPSKCRLITASSKQ